MDTNIDYVGSLKTTPIPIFRKNSGVLASIDVATNTFWPIERVFFISSESNEERGNHAHKTCKQLFVCISGILKILCKDGTNEKEFILNGLGNTLYIPPGIWVSIKMEPNTSVAVITDQEYDDADYIRNWESFVDFRANK